MKVEVKEIAINTQRGQTVAASKFFCKSDIKKTMVISSATGVLQKYYARFAHFLATKGFTVYTFDYSGIGKSNSSVEHLKNSSVDLKDWANDQAVVVAFAKEAHIGSELILTAHSIGGQLIGLNPNYHMLDKIIMVASQSGYWKNFKGFHSVKMWLLWYVIIPSLTAIFGYFPAKKLGLFENLPKNMVYEWAKWGKKKKYMMHFHDPKTYFFDAIKIPILSWSFSHDHFAPKKTVDWLSDQYKNASVTRIHYHPENEARQPRHFGFFKPDFKDPLWTRTLDWLLNDNSR